MISLMTNVDSLVAQQNLNVNSQFQSNTIDQLTSGYRINSSADDAAGLSVANGYRNQIAELNQGVLNANQGVSQLQIVDGGLSNISQMLDRLQTLATESASQTFTGNRGTLETEYSGLLGEIDRQADNVGLGDTNTTNSANLSVYIGGGQSAQDNSSVSVDLAGQSVSSTGLGLANTGVLNTPPATLGSTAATLLGAGDSQSFTIDTASGSQTVSVTGAAGDTIAGQVTELNAGLAAYGITASLNSSNEIQLQSSTGFTVQANAPSAGTGLTASTDKAVNTGLYNNEYTAAAGDTLTITSGSQTASVALGLAPGQAGVALINAALTAAGITSVGAVLDAGSATGQISLEGSSTFTATAATGALGGIVAPTGTGGNPTAAINAITAAVQILGTAQGIVGAGENKLNYAISLATSQITNFSSAQSQIRDANVAQEAANLTQSQVIEQASIAAMAQANQEPQALLKLLQG
jgi:flagellin